MNGMNETQTIQRGNKMSTATKVTVKEIKITRVEGYQEECNQPIMSSNWDEANAVLRAMAITAPKDNTYNKVDFVVTYTDGETYEGRYYLQYTDTGIVSPFMADLAKHVQVVVHSNGKRKADWKEFETKYDMGETSKN